MALPAAQQRHGQFADIGKLVAFIRTTEVKEPTRMKKERDPGIPSAVAGSAENYSDNVVLHAERGHGFAGEKANHLADVLSGRDAKLVGGDNRRDGADRIVNGLEIQTKYCRTGSECVGACFRDGEFRYMGNNGPMLIEVPSDKYDAAVQAMEHRIQNGQVPGVSDPGQARAIVRKSWFTYAQVKNIARFGTIESLTYDAANGIRLAGTSMGISAVVAFAVAIWNGEDAEDALKTSCMIGLQIGSMAWVTSILAAQLGRTGVEQGLRGTTDWAVQQVGPQVSSWLANGLRAGSPIYGAAAANHLSKLLRGNIVTGAVATLILSSADLTRLFKGRMSVGQVLMNVTTTGAGVAGGSGGWVVGSAAGAGVGSAIPWIGPRLGRLIGGVSGALLCASGASKAASAVLHTFIEDDARAMLGILEESFGELAHEYLLGPEDARTVIDKLIDANDLPVKLRDMYASDDRSRFSKTWLRALVQLHVRERERIPASFGGDAARADQVGGLRDRCWLNSCHYILRKKLWKLLRKNETFQ